eukprot:7374509-Alexandrium_andersonii.AAC.1
MCEGAASSLEQFPVLSASCRAPKPPLAQRATVLRASLQESSQKRFVGTRHATSYAPRSREATLLSEAKGNDAPCPSSTLVGRLPHPLMRALK